ncbi:hypothetical protein SNS2_4815 [Streptomyces netropsis]|uniref:Small hydrophobic protein n=1 Tax=Streptomyces syringium TaxID=76729 RepID=A0ABS4YCU1_9ACTN|nr:DUF6126 family protein [Streptomyces syringium]MBP2406615.1 hypothetical protein [Streptomyces syringium]SPE63491.1 hypothetical protein SNS2_4815 [Streptomyces netropsis]
MTDDPAGQAAPPRDLGAGSEKYKEKAVAFRVLIYVVVSHLLAGFIWLLFYLGEHAPK